MPSQLPEVSWEYRSTAWMSRPDLWALPALSHVVLDRPLDFPEPEPLPTTVMVITNAGNPC